MRSHPALAVGLLVLVPAVSAPAGPDADLVRGMLLDLAAVARSDALAQRARSAPVEVLDAMATQMPDVAAVAAGMRRLRDGATTPRAVAPPLSSGALPYPPEYPSGGSYDVFVATLPGLGLLSDSNGDGKLNDERCSADGVAETEISFTALQETSIGLQASCDSITVFLGEGTNAPWCIAAGIANAATAAADTVLRQCDYQDGNVDSAEIEAAYENSKNIIDRLDAIEGKLDLVIRAMIEENLHNDSGSRIGSFYLPEEVGGRLSLVREIVSTTIAANETAGLRVVHAQKWLAMGDEARRNKDWKKAFEAYKRSYRQATYKSTGLLP